jgi:hypothetical protein
MKINRLIFSMFIIPILLYSCKKEFSVVNPVSLSSVTVINATTGSGGIIPNFAKSPVQYFAYANVVGYGSFYEYSIPSGATPVSVWQKTDTIHVVFKGTFTLQSQGIYSLYLCGDNLTSPDTLFTHDILAYHSVTDSVAGVRFVNLSPGSNPVSVDIQGNANGSEVSSLAYKKITSFKIYTDTNENPNPSTGYIFEFRDQASGNLLATYTYNNIARFRNVTIVLYGDPGNQSTFQVNNY